MDHPDTDGKAKALQARAALEQATEARRAAAQATRRPAWTDLTLAIVGGATVALGLLGHRVGAVVVLVAGSAAFALLHHRVTRRRGQVIDLRAIASRSWRFAIGYGVLFLLTQFEPPAAWQPWYALGAGVAVATGGFAWLRWDDRYQAARLAAGDFDRYDLI